MSFGVSVCKHWPLPRLRNFMLRTASRLCPCRGSQKDTSGICFTNCRSLLLIRQNEKASLSFWTLVLKRPVDFLVLGTCSGLLGNYWMGLLCRSIPLSRAAWMVCVLWRLDRRPSLLRTPVLNLLIGSSGVSTQTPQTCRCVPSR